MTDTNTDRGGAVALLPCPFCGGKADVHVGRHAFTDAIVECDACNCEGPLQDEDGDLPHEKISKAIVAWNHRHPTPQTDTDAREKVVEALERLSEWRDRMMTDPCRAAHFGSPYADKPMADGRTYWNRDLAADLSAILAALKTGDA